MYNPLKYVDPSGERCCGVDWTCLIEQMMKEIVINEWRRLYDNSMASHFVTLAMASCLFSHGEENSGSSANHGSPLGNGGGSVEARSLGNGKYEVVNGLYDGGNTVYIVDEEGNRTGILGYTLTPYTFYDDDGLFVNNAIIDLNDYSGQNFIDDFTTNPPNIITYKQDIVNGDNGTDISLYNFKAVGMPKGLNSDERELYYYRSMSINYGDGTYIASARDIGNFAAGYLCGINGFTYTQTRILFDGYQFKLYRNIEPHVSQLAQDCGFNWGRGLFFRIIQIPFYY